MARAKRLCTAEEMDIVKTFECGQCFRWNVDSDGVYTGVSDGRQCKVWLESDTVYIDCEDKDEEYWRYYFDMETDYEAARRSLMISEYLSDCAEQGKGIRILRQEKWETLCSFIVSQCNNIPRIKSIVESLCENFGECRERNGEKYYTFPSALAMSTKRVEDLAVLRSGYRAAYILSAAEAVSLGTIDLEATSKKSGKEARATLRTINGVGEKVANCVVLFGFHHMDAFPVDVWIRRVLKERLPTDFKVEDLGEYAGLAQQYMFYSARSLGT